MSGKVIYKPTQEVLCKEGFCATKPYPNQASNPPGTVWECGDCGKKWVNVSNGGGLSAWQILRPWNKRGRALFA